MAPKPLLLRATLVGSWVLFSASVLFRPHQAEYNAWFDVGLYALPFLFAALAAFIRARQEPAGSGWNSLGIGLLFQSAGNVYGSVVIGDKGTFPSPADAFWLSFYLFAYIGVIQLVRSRVDRFEPSTWLDGAVGGFGAATLVAAFVVDRFLTDEGGSISVVTTTLAYPTADVLLIVILVAAGTAIRARDASFWLLGLGFLLFCVADVIFLFQEAADTYLEGGLLDISWPLAVTVIGLAATVPGADGAPQRHGRTRAFVPILFGGTTLTLLVYGQWRQLPTGAVVLAVVTLLAAVTRTGMAFREVRALAESRLEARTDPLTGLTNRRGFTELLDKAVEAVDRPPFCVLMIDLDGFKDVNDSLGHSVGDDLLRHVAERFRRGVPNDQVLARLGGDEFGVIAAAGTGIDVANRLIEAMADPFVVDDISVRVGVSIGISQDSGLAMTRSELLRTADVAMYQAKRGHAGLRVYAPGDDPHSREKLGLHQELHQAIQEQALELYYQPILDIADQQIVGLEGLVRWPHPTHGLLLPDDFIPMAEQSGLVTSLTRSVLDLGIAQLSGLHRQGHRLQLNLNISGLDIVDETLAGYVAATLAVHDVDPQYLTLEITESVLAKDPIRAERTVRQLQGRGVRISIDDFGIGYSSLSLLLDLPFDELKVDRSFVVAGGDNDKARAILNSTVELGRVLGVGVVVEGVENEASMQLVIESKAARAQGYFISHPLQAAQLAAYLAPAAAPLSDACWAGDPPSALQTT